MTATPTWQTQVGHQRDWLWRGWQVRYTFLRSPTGRDRPPILLLHGFGASIGHWRHNLTALAAHHPVYAIDLLGFGASEKAAAPYGAVFWAELVQDFWATFIQRPMVLVGNSIGSQVCVATAGMHPERVAGLALLNLPDPSVMETAPWVKPALAMLGTLSQPIVGLLKRVFTSPPVFNPFFALIRQPAFVRFWASQAYHHPSAISEELLDILSQPAYDQGAARALRAMVNQTGAIEDYTARRVLPRLTMPILLLWGQQDRMVPPSLGPLFTRYNPHLELRELADAGHCPHDECPAAVNTILLDWLQTKI